MKKVFLAVAVIVIFVIYSLHQRHEDGTATLTTRKATSSSQPGSSSQSPSSSDTGSSGSSSPTATSGSYKDGNYTGSVEDAFYGNVQVAVVIQSGKITAVNFLQYPNDRPTSRMINDQAIPILQQEAISAQRAQVDTVSGATDTSLAFVKSLTAALSHAS